MTTQSVDHQVFQNFVDGRFVEARSHERADIFDPSTGEVYATAPVSSAEDVDAAVQAASRAFETWRDTTPAERQRALLHIADAIDAHAEELVEI